MPRILVQYVRRRFDKEGISRARRVIKEEQLCSTIEEVSKHARVAIDLCSERSLSHAFDELSLPQRRQRSFPSALAVAVQQQVFGHNAWRRPILYVPYRTLSSVDSIHHVDRTCD